MAKIEIVVGGRHPGLIRIPDQQVEGHRFFAFEIIVYVVGPDQVVRPSILKALAIAEPSR